MKRIEAEGVLKSLKYILVFFAITISFCLFLVISDNHQTDIVNTLPTTDNSKAIYEKIINRTTENFTLSEIKSFSVPPTIETKATTSTTTKHNTYSYTVYITATGTKYHRISCGALWNTCYSIEYNKAIKEGYKPCDRCNP